jgi:Flp pilus assembly protein TadG
MSRSYRVHLHADRRAATAVEFALVCAPFTIFLLAVLSVALQFYLQQALDYATQAAVRQVQLGHLSAGYTEADFIEKIFCPAFADFQACVNLTVDLRPVTNYEDLAGATGAPNSASTTGVFCPGTPGQLMYAHVVYLAPSIGGTLLGGSSSGTGVLVSNAAFANENPTGIAVNQAGGC